MNKLWRFLDETLLKWGVALALAFVPLYPKLPSIHVIYTWVYIRLEDFLIAALSFLWLIIVVRRKTKVPFALGMPIILYWFFGFATLAVSLVFIAPHLANFFPNVAILSYGRRIEYMILFFIAFATIKGPEDIKFYLKVIFITLAGVLLYGFGQRYYLLFWNAFPKIAERFPYCFPSFQTGNEEFAKGVPLCLPFDARITSTFGGHYDLAAYLVVVISILLGTIFAIRSRKNKILLSVLFIGSVIMLIFTSSRISIVAYVIGAILVLFLAKRKRYIVPLILVTILLLFAFSGSTVNRFAQTFRIASVVTNSEGQVIGYTQNSLPANLRKKISNGAVTQAAPPPSQSLPVGTSFITLPQKTTATQKTQVAIVQKNLSNSAAKQLDYQYGGVQLSAVSGNFTIRKVLVYDISITTRIQGEWPNAWAAFLREPALGSGFATITLAVDNDYLRLLGESGILGLTSFLFIFLMLFVVFRTLISHIKDTFSRNFLFGITGGVVGLFVNGLFYDTLISSKVAETLWLFLGLSAGILIYYQHKEFNYWKSLIQVLASRLFIALYLFILVLILLLPHVGYFFVADDFTWLKWAASATLSDLGRYFIDAQGFFYRPLDKLLMVFYYSFFGFQPDGYHFMTILTHFFTGLGVYMLLHQLFKKKIWAFVGAVSFLTLAGHAENIFWIAAISPNLATMFGVYAVLGFLSFRNNKNVVGYIFSIICTTLALLSYEMGVVVIGLLFISDLTILKNKFTKSTWISYIPYIVILIIYGVIRSIAHVVPAGGDYSYSFAHFLPNVIGNLFGYLGLFLLGPVALSPYTILRSTLRSQWMLVSIGIAIILIFIGIYIKKYRQQVEKYTDNLQITLFGSGFTIIGLLPFLGLGNISERYLYLGSIGLVVLLVQVLEAFYNWVAVKNKKRAMQLVGICTVIFITWQVFSLEKVAMDWKVASQITSNTLGYFKVKEDNHFMNDDLYFINLPIRYGDAWVFPVGLNDPLWFIYRDATPHIHILKNGEKPPVSVSNPDQGIFIFVFDHKGQVKDILPTPTPTPSPIIKK